MALGYKVELRNARLDLIRDAIDADTDPGTITIYDGTRPATGASEGSAKTLSVGTFSQPSAPDAATGVLTFDEIVYTDGLDDGTATWARIRDGSGAFIADASVGVTGSGADITINSVGIITDGPVTHVEAKITAGNV
jgi:hypothetical protein